MAKVKMIKYIPSTERYHIFCPENYILNEDEGGIVTITSPQGEINLTLSGYESNVKVDTSVLTDLFSTVTEGYETRSNSKIEAFGEGLVMEGEYSKNKDHWIWKIYTKNKNLVVVSINSDGILKEEFRNIIEFMLQNFELYSDR